MRLRRRRPPVRRPVAPVAVDSRVAPSSGRRVLGTIVLMVSLSLTLGAIFGEQGVLELFRYKSEAGRLEVEIAQLEAECLGLEREIRSLRTNPLALERIAREELGLGLPGEVLVFLDTTPRRPSASVPDEEPTAP